MKIDLYAVSSCSPPTSRRSRHPLPEPSQACLEAMSRSFELMKALDDVVDWDAMSDEDFDQAVGEFERQAGLHQFSREEQDAAFFVLLAAANLTEQ